VKFAYSTINWGRTCDLEQTFQQIRDAGWSAVELYGHNLDWLGAPSQLKRKLGGLHPATVFASLGSPKDRDELTIHKNRIDYCAEIGASAYGLVGAQRLRWRAPSEDELKEMAAFCEELAEHGATQDVLVSYHPHTGCTAETTPEIDVLMGASSQLKLCLDASHIAVVGEDPQEVVDRFWDRVGYFHIKDWGDGKFVELGDGTLGIDFPALLRHIQDRGFTGWMVVENSRSEVSAESSANANAKFLTEHGFEIN
jgi:sugar phosphate isomerase/epimerase